jgi:hypothetical protein
MLRVKLKRFNGALVRVNSVPFIAHVVLRRVKICAANTITERYPLFTVPCTAGYVACRQLIQPGLYIYMAMPLIRDVLISIDVFVCCAAYRKALKVSQICSSFICKDFRDFRAKIQQELSYVVNCPMLSLPVLDKGIKLFLM